MQDAWLLVLLRRVGPVLFQEVIKWTGPLTKIRWTYDELEGIVS